MPRKPRAAVGEPTPVDAFHGYSSPPCYAHEVDPAYFSRPATLNTVDIPALKRARRNARTAIDLILRATSRR